MCGRKINVAGFLAIPSDAEEKLINLCYSSVLFRVTRERVVENLITLCHSSVLVRITGECVEEKLINLCYSSVLFRVTRECVEGRLTLVASLQPLQMRKKR